MSILEMFLQPGGMRCIQLFSQLGGARVFVHFFLVRGRSVGLRGMRIPDTSITQKFFFFI
jgi:hypothetical protein